MRAAAYDAGAPARCVASVGGSEETLFLVGTLKARGDNEVHVVAHDRDRDALDARRVFAHAHEIWDLQPHPRDAALLATLFHDPSSGRADHAGAVWRLPGGASATDRDDDAPPPAPPPPAPPPLRLPPSPPPRAAASFPRAAPCARWNPADAGVVAVVDDEHLRVLHLDAAASSLGEQGRVALEGVAAAASSALGAWDPASPRVFAVCAGPSVALFDLRTSATATSSRPAVLVEAAHAGRALDLEFVRGARAEMVTCGEDGAVRAWDLRGGSGSGSGSSGGGDAGASGRARSTDESSGFPGPRASLRSTLGRHAHWATRVAVNPTYDTLVVSASSDGAAALWSSAKAGGGGGRRAGRERVRGGRGGVDRGRRVERGGPVVVRRARAGGEARAPRRAEGAQVRDPPVTKGEGGERSERTSEGLFS